MATFGQATNQDTNGIKTTAVYGDPGDGVDTWFQDQRLVDGADVSQGAKADSATVTHSGSFSVISLLKGLLIRENAIATSQSYSASAVEPTRASTTALATNLVVKAGPGRLRSIVGYSTLAQFIQIHNTTTLPADAAVPVLVIPIEADKPFSIDFGLTGLPLGTGIVVCNSTTGPTKTIGAADTWITAVYQ